MRLPPIHLPAWCPGLPWPAPHLPASPHDPVPLQPPDLPRHMRPRWEPRSCLCPGQAPLPPAPMCPPPGQMPPSPQCSPCWEPEQGVRIPKLETVWVGSPDTWVLPQLQNVWDQITGGGGLGPTSERETPLAWEPSHLVSIPGRKWSLIIGRWERAGSQDSWVLPRLHSAAGPCWSSCPDLCCSPSRFPPKPPDTPSCEPC